MPRKQRAPAPAPKPQYLETIDRVVSEMGHPTETLVRRSYWNGEVSSVHVCLEFEPKANTEG